MLDIGYGNGSFLRVAQAAGLEAFGHDLHQRKDGIRRGDLSNPYTIITMFDSLEHFSCFDQLQLRSQHLIVSIPERPTWPIEQLPMWRHFKPGEHIHYFSQQSLIALAYRLGYAFSHFQVLEDVARTPQPGTSINIGTYHFIAR